MMTSPSLAASPTEVTRSPAAVALAADDEPSRSATRTSTPESRRLRAWA